MKRTSEPTGTEGYSRRTALKALGAATTVGLAGCSGYLGGQSEFEQQLDTVREATADYTDPMAAMEDGFVAGGPYVPGMGWHWQHPERTGEIANDGFDLEKPNLITYLDTDEGLQLGAVEWGGPVQAVPEQPDLFADDGAETWHVHDAATHVFALPDGQQTPPPEVPLEEWITNDNWAEFRPPDPELEAGDTVALEWGSLEATPGEGTERVLDVVATHPDLNTLHAWVHTDNPEGVFHPTNPDYAPGDHDH